MAELTFSKNSDKTRDELWDWLSSKEDLMERKLRKQSPQLTKNEQNKTMNIKGKHFSALIQVDDGRLDVKVTLPLLFRAFKGTISQAIEDIFSKEVQYQ